MEKQEKIAALRADLKNIEGKISQLEELKNTADAIRHLLSYYEGDSTSGAAETEWSEADQALIDGLKKLSKKQATLYLFDHFGGKFRNSVCRPLLYAAGHLSSKDTNAQSNELGKILGELKDEGRVKHTHRNLWEKVKPEYSSTLGLERRV